MSETGPELSFEEALTKLEEIVGELEGGQLPLEQALERFEEAMRLKTQCEELLARAETRIEELTTTTEEEAEEEEA